MYVLIFRFACVVMSKNTSEPSKGLKNKAKYQRFEPTFDTLLQVAMSRKLPFMKGAGLVSVFSVC